MAHGPMPDRPPHQPSDAPSANGRSDGSGIGEVARRAAHRITIAAGSWQLFAVSVGLLMAWGASGPLFGFSDTWQLIVNTSTTIFTYLLGILILLEANRQARESKVVHDELIRVLRGTRAELTNIDQMTDGEVERLQEDLRRRAARSTPGEQQG
jgi:low affinity Fe/Cu permease